jgi:creatinine amidohydrolase
MAEWNLAETCLGVSGDAEYEVAVLPVGATEAHGLHLPYATDTIQVEAIAKAACAKASGRGGKVLLLPAIPYGVNENNLEFPWTMSVRPSTLFSFITDVVLSVEHHEIPKLVLLNGHGGNEFQPLLRELCRQTSVQIILVNWYRSAESAARKLFENAGDHADEMETSMLLNLHPELVHMELAGNGAVRPPVLTALKEGWGWVARPWERLTFDSGVGDPSKATAEKGKEYFATVVEKLAGLLVEMSKAPVDDWYPYKEDG